MSDSAPWTLVFHVHFGFLYLIMVVQRQRPARFPGIPDSVTAARPSSMASVQQAHGILTEAYDSASRLLRFEDGDPLRLRLYADRLMLKMIPMVLELEKVVDCQEWLVECTLSITALVRELEDVAVIAEKVYVIIQ